MNYFLPTNFHQTFLQPIPYRQTNQHPCNPPNLSINQILNYSGSQAHSIIPPAKFNIKFFCSVIFIVHIGVCDNPLPNSPTPALNGLKPNEPGCPIKTFLIVPLNC